MQLREPWAREWSLKSGKCLVLMDVHKRYGQPARGTYNKTADGKLEIVKVRFGKKAGGGKKGGKKSEPPATQAN